MVEHFLPNPTLDRVSCSGSFSMVTFVLGNRGTEISPGPFRAPWGRHEESRRHPPPVEPRLVRVPRGYRPG